ncbi:MAG TPA: hypothetical protein VJH97_06280 [Candidatus Nanoarchaeia archaeon]|nr:hypothetical protein [Candidatus Nanoarchaeia archaeon]
MPKCPMCKGRGKIELSHCEQDGEEFLEVYDGEKECSQCKGAGYID